MPSASVAGTAIASDLKCSGCGNPIIKDGKFKCLRCSPHRLVPATLDRQDIVCPRHERPVVLMRYDRKSDQYRAYCQKRGCPNYKARISTSIQFEVRDMSQAQEATVAGEKKSKTQELRDWLDGEIKRCENDASMLQYALEQVSNSFTKNWQLAWNRYGALTSDERELKVAEDRKKLEELQKRLELLRSARELDVDVDSFDEAGVKLTVRRSDNNLTTYLPRVPGHVLPEVLVVDGKLIYKGSLLMCFNLLLGSRGMWIETHSNAGTGSINSRQHVRNITSFSARRFKLGGPPGRWGCTFRCTYYPSDNKGEEWFLDVDIRNLPDGINISMENSLTGHGLIKR